MVEGGGGDFIFESSLSIFTFPFLHSRFATNS